LGPENVTGIHINPSWQLPDEEIITRVKLGFTSRLLEKSALKLSGWLAIQKNDDPAYGTSFVDSQELFLSTSYNPSPFWGFLATLNLLDQNNNQFEISGFETTTYQPTETFDIDRNKKQQNLSLGTWVNPREGLSFDLNYGFMRTAINQDLLYGKVTDPVNYSIEDNNVDYHQTVQTVTLGMTLQPLEKLSCRLEGYHIRSQADYDPGFSNVGVPYYYPNGANADSSDLRAISKVDIRQNGVRGRVNWAIDEAWSCAVDASYDDYDDGDSDAYDGSVQTCMVSFSRNW
jgi:hypothetical protein